MPKQFVYETDTKILWFDADGTGTTWNTIPITDFAGCTGALDISDFVVV